MTTPDAALLWAREQHAEVCGHPEIALSILAGNHDFRLPITVRAEAFRADQSHDAGLLAALEEIDRRYTAWLAASPTRDVPGVKPGTIRNMGNIARAAIAAAKGA